MFKKNTPIKQMQTAVQSESWVNEFIAQNSTLIETNPNAACSKLSNRFVQEYSSISLQMIGNAVISFAQSLKAWIALYNFKTTVHSSTIPYYERQCEKVRAYIERCANCITPLLQVQQLSESQLDQLGRANGWLEDAKNVLDSIRQDCENKIHDAENQRLENGVSAVVNLVAFVVEAFSFRKKHLEDEEWNIPKVAAVISTAAHGVCALGDICAVLTANDLVKELQKQLKLINELETERIKWETKLDLILAENRTNNSSAILN